MKSQKIIISVTGLGYVGLPVAVAFGKNKRVIGFDINEMRIKELCNGRDRTREVDSKDIKAAQISFTKNPEDLREANFHIIAVPTPIDEAKQPDLRPLLDATKTIGRILKRGDVVVYESTVYPGCTEEICVPVLEEQSSLRSGQDFGVGYSPERINPGDLEHTFTKIKKVVSGNTPEVAERVADVYLSVVSAGVQHASSINVAEAAKVIENAQRDLNIAFVNELAIIFERLCIDTNEVLKLACTKWNFLPFRPGLVGGHCIGVDPYYLTHRAEMVGYQPQIILAGRRINDGMGVFVARHTVKLMSREGIGAVGAKVAVLGITFKEDCPDLRNSLVLDIVDELTDYGCALVIHDPICDPEDAQVEYGIELCQEAELNNCSAVVVAVAHSAYQNWTAERWHSMFVPGGVLADVKSFVPKDELKAHGIKVWRL